MANVETARFGHWSEPLMTAPTLPEPVLLSLGRITSDFAVIEENLKDHCAYMEASSAGWRGFKALRERWQKLALARYSTHKYDVELIAQRLERRAKARNWAVHWVWSVDGDQLLGSSKNYDYNRLPAPVDRLPTTIAELGEQAQLVTALRQDLLELLSLLQIAEDELLGA